LTHAILRKVNGVLIILLSTESVSSHKKRDNIKVKLEKLTKKTL